MPNFYPQLLSKKIQQSCVALFAFTALFLSINLHARAANTSLPFQGNGKIAGKVVDEKGETIPGVTVRIAQTTIGAQTAIDGSFSLSVKPGTYTVEILLISYQTKRITDVIVKAGDVTSLNVSLTPQTTTLNEVVVNSSFAKASTEGLYSRQKNAPAISNGISAEQIMKTPDATVGQSLKRISGLTTFDNKYVVVRGISERYNVATVDGTPMPSTDYSQRNFNFDMIPAEMIEGITVLKTVTPDLPVGFAGGLVQINTRDIPTKNFVSFTVGTGGNDQSTGRNFISTARGKYDYLGFDDGTRKMLNGPITFTTGKVTEAGDPAGFTPADYEQSKRFTNNWKLYNYKAMPNQNYSFTLGQTYNVKKDNSSERFGFILALNYRNTQTITNVQNNRSVFLLSPEVEDSFNGKPTAEGKRYNFNTTYGGVLNFGYRNPKHQVSSRNTFSRVFSNPLTMYYGYDNDGGEFTGPEYNYSLLRILTEPDFLTLLQNKIQGEHQLPSSLKFTWDVSRTSIDRQRKDMLRRELYNNNQQYGNYFHDDISSDAISVYPLSRQGMSLKEVDYNWSASVSKPIFKGDFAGTLKIGYNGFSKKQQTNFSSAYLRPSTGYANFELGHKFNVENEHIPENFAPNRFVYQIPDFGLDGFEGNSSFHAGYAMVDQKLWKKLRVVGGFRVEYFKLALLGDAITALDGLFSNPNTVLIPDDRDYDKPWRILPSFNLSYAVNDRFNIRAAYSQTMVRPEFNERSLSSRYDPDLQGTVTGGIVLSTKTTSYDVRAEYYPGTGEIISIGAFHKYLDRPLELTKQGSQDLYVYSNSIYAKSYGIEAEVRRKLGFLNENLPILDKFTVFGNATLLWSKVLARLPAAAAPVNGDPLVLKLSYQIDPQTRPLYGQTPFLLNTGVEYNGDVFGVNIVHNHTGRKFFILTNNPGFNEWEAPYDQVDLQLNANLFQKKGKVRFNLGNVFNNQNFFYNGHSSYQNAPDTTQPRILKPGFSDAFEKGDIKTFRRTYGRSFIVTFSYTF